MKINSYTTALAGLIAFTTFSCQKQVLEERPNVIFILADDLGYGDLKSLNPQSHIPTPYLDRLVSEGIHFTDAHSNSAVCTPTRYGIMTGRYAFRSRLKSGVLWGYSSSLVEPDRTTIGEFLEGNGYHTAFVGKWHLGLDWTRLDLQKPIPDVQWDEIVTRDFQDNVDYNKPVKGGPSDNGFGYSLIIPASLDMSPYCYIRNGIVEQTPTSYTDGKSQEIDGRGVFWRPGKMSPDFDFEKVLPNFVDSACTYIARNAGKEKPFFLYLSLPSPHTPWLPVEEYTGKSAAGKYGDFVAMTDDMVGKVLHTVEKLKIDKNTLIIFTSDNGSDWRPSDIEKYGHKANYIFKGRKADIYEAGHRIPFIARWKGVIPENKASDQLICTTDLLAIFSGMLNKPLHDTDGEDSYNLWPAFKDEAYNLPIRNQLIHHSLDGYFSIRKGRWKYTPQLGSGGFTEPKIIFPKANEPIGTLYDIVNDPMESDNLYLQYPDTVKVLEKLLHSITDETELLRDKQNY